jgi:flagellar biosynthesis/type III secretory pathway chaperone
MDGNNTQEILYYQIIDLWKRFCEEHHLLFEQTMDEYSALLESDTEKVESMVESKAETIERINQLEKLRSHLIAKVNETLPEGQKVNGVGDLILVMQEFEKRSNNNHLFRFNQLLIDIIEKIQEQNKKNQLFINKAIIALREIRENALGKKYHTYTPRGSTTTKTKEHISTNKS